jgi:predicted RNase H-like nuclease (RuvC/YqgF family)
MVNNTVPLEEWENQVNENLNLKKIISQMENKSETVSKIKYDASQQALELFREKNISLQKHIEALKRDYISMVDELEQLKKQVEKKKGIKTGRKPLDKSIVDRVHQLKMNKLSIREIQRTLSMEGILISVGVIHKVINGVK